MQVSLYKINFPTESFYFFKTQLTEARGNQHLFMFYGLLTITIKTGCGHPLSLIELILYIWQRLCRKD